MPEPIRVLQVFALMNRGGAETMIMNLYRSIDRSRVQFDFIVHTEEECAYDAEIESLGGTIYRMPKYTGKNHITYKKRWREFFGEHREYQIIHGHVRSTAVIYLAIAKQYGLTTIAHSHSTSSGYGVSSIVKSMMQLPLRYMADHIFACSEESGRWLFGKKASKNRLHVLQNAINAENFIYNEDTRDAKRKELDIENKYVVGHIGRFEKVKNHTYLIDIFKAVHDSKEDAVLLLVGDGDLRQEIISKVNRMGLSDRVIFAGVRTDIPQLLQAMDVFVFPSLYEGIPVTLVEAQASGMHCIVSDTISKDVFVTDRIETVSLDQPVKMWSDAVLRHYDGYDRNNTYDAIIDAGFDVRNTAKWLEGFYLRINEDRTNDHAVQDKI